MATSAAPRRVPRSLRASPAARALLDRPAPRRAIAALRAARVLRPAGRFLACELRPGLVGGYALTTTGVKVHVRHASRDVAILNEIFAPGRACYEPPPAVAAALAGRGPLRIADAGGNVGLFGAFALGRWPVVSLRSYEPDPANAALLRATIAANDAASVWELVEAAVSNAAGEAAFESGMLAESRLAGPGGVRAGTIAVAVLDLFAQPAADLLKLDVEGAEWAILADARLAAHPARAVALEWHSRLCPARDPHGAARELLRAAGYTVIEPDGGPSPGAVNGLLWGLREATPAPAGPAPAQP